MARKKTENSKIVAWNSLVDVMSERVPRFWSWCGDAEDFSELRLKAREDGTVLAIAKGYGPDGTPIVAFGSGYDLASAIVAIDATITGGHWRLDEPYQPNSS